MEKNVYLISYYSHSKKNGQVYRNYCIVFNGVFTPVKLDSNLDFIKDNAKRCPCYARETYQKLINGEITFDEAKTVTYKEYVSVYVGV